MSWARFALALAFLGLASCANERREPDADVTLVLASYSAPRDAFERGILPAFQAQHEARTGKRIRVRASYLASGAQSRAVASGFPADVVVLALAPDVTRLEKEKLITHDWRRRGRRGSFTTSVVALAVRQGNPKGVTGFSDLARPSLDVLMPNPKTSGGAMWNVSALWVSALRGHAGVAANNEGAAQGYLRDVLKNVAIMDKGARESLITFEKGVGDVAVTYESEVFAGRAAGRSYDMVIPASTMVVEVMAAVVDVNATKHALLPEAEAFVDYLSSNEAQHILAKYGFRSDDPEVRAAHADAFPEVQAPVRIDALGGWDEVVPKLFGKEGVFPRTWETVYATP
ncbi:sulfate ABC transporter substrate-binding protein [Polyangium mundeleinium]|uniref:Sulfate ABC transporter substrate-binding protein n=1 Tax=Polyangium mundeleinium TaxID=2995306 RepID=A0ABT5F5Z9_9BACT|nr:sulfate ABC transporter substrate-binding protein [Polyangium mundeleinium]MDC0749528.1 sulfate ABC transporter substrate-binding protein [Polyangium mundeleinium]